MIKYTALGLMSGSSLDGLDIAYCEFYFEKGKWSFEIVEAQTFSYNEEWSIKLRELPNYTAKEIERADIEYGELTADFVNQFLSQKNYKPDLIASHGHTILHEPAKGFTLQIGNGQVIANKTGIKTINDFRKRDVLLGGQGAPLVPIGDKLLFSNYDFCLNIGGIANISFEENGKRLAFDICGANQILNYLSLQVGKPFDENGNLAILGKMNTKLFNLLNSDSYFNQKHPKSLSNQYVALEFIEATNKIKCPIQDKLYTTVKHIAYQVNNAIETHKKGSLLLSGGGTHNSFMVTAIKRETKHEIIIPDTITINFKEALIFAFMGILKDQGKINCLASVTGARTDCSAGIVYYP